MIELKAFIRVKIGKIVLKSKMAQLFWDTFFFKIAQLFRDGGSIIDAYFAYAYF